MRDLAATPALLPSALPSSAPLPPLRPSPVPSLPSILLRRRRCRVRTRAFLRRVACSAFCVQVAHLVVASADAVAHSLSHSHPAPPAAALPAPVSFGRPLRILNRSSPFAPHSRFLLLPHAASPHIRLPPIHLAVSLSLFHSLLHSALAPPSVSLCTSLSSLSPSFLFSALLARCAIAQTQHTIFCNLIPIHTERARAREEQETDAHQY